MKPYFTKYLPAGGEIKEGDYYTPSDDWYVEKATKEDLLICNDSHNGYKKVKLFLCSRDIQVGDDIIFSKEKYPLYKEKLLSHPEDLLIKDRKEKGAFKVLGEISPEAIWVKEGDEFDERELCCFVAVGFGSGSQIHILPFTTEKGQNKLLYGIKGPCGHFH